MPCAGKNLGTLVTIGLAFRAARSDICRLLQIKHPNDDGGGARYSKMMKAWLAKYEVDIEKSVRSKLLDCIDHLTAIEEWRTSLKSASPKSYKRWNTQSDLGALARHPGEPSEGCGQLA